MTKSTFGDQSTTPGSNTSLDGNDVSENCAMSGMNNAMRSLAAMGKSAGTFIATTGTDTYLSTFAPIPDALATDFFYGVNIASANTSTTPTWNPSSLGPKTIVDMSGNALLAGALNGRHIFIYDGTNFRVLNPAKFAVPAGGTGAATLAAHGVLVGAGTGPIAVTGTGTTGQVLTSNGASADPTFQALTAQIIKQQVFTSNGTFTAPAGTTTSTVYKFTVVGAGGGGGGGSGTAAGGGGGGATAIYYGTGIAAAATVAVTVGTAGTAGSGTSTGGTGVASSIVFNGTTVTANGGSGGLNASGGGSGGTASNGTLNLGGQGGNALTSTTVGGGGGCSTLGGGAGSGGGAGGTGATYGGGGAGGGVGNAGGAGGAGVVIVEWVQ